jgi:Dolichyl-phosphate-mannose-protein mannosyltransferase
LRSSLFFFRLGAWWSKRWGLVLVTLAALAMRLWWNLRVHRPLDFVYSDMAAYLDRADAMLDGSGAASPALTLFPYGTHFFVFLVKRVFGRDDATAIGVAFAVLGALAVAYTYATAARLSERAWVRRGVGVGLVFYYPWISLGGYVLSEIPFALCVAGSAFHGLRLADRGRRWDAWLLGLFLGAGAAVRPQILLAAALLLVHLALRRRAWKHFTAGLAARVATPLAIVLALSALRFHHHTGGWGLVSSNGPLNTVFARCHNLTLFARAPDVDSYFSPPSLRALRDHEKQGGEPLFTLDPAFGEELTIEGHLWDAEPNRRLAERCVARTGWLRQAEHAAGHVALLWVYNSIWPDQGQRRVWRDPMRIACALHAYVILPPAALGLLLALRRRRARSLVLAVHVYGVVFLAMLYFGDTRYRAPYDGLLILFALQTYAELGHVLQCRAERLLLHRGS